MLFNSPEFLVFAVLVIGAYYLLRRRVGWQNLLLLVSSYAFYAFWDYRFLSLIWVSTAVDYSIARLMPHAPNPRQRRLYLGISLIVNLGLLGFFKYFNFFVGSAADALQQLGFQVNEPTLSIILPVGISFYTFQTLAYTIDVYRGNLKPEKNLLNFALYVCYFPQLVAGPIERAQNLLPAIRMPRTTSLEQWMSGLTLCLIGFFKKIAIADTLAIFVDRGFSAPSDFGSFELLCIAYLFAFQIYADFSGYSDIARGVSRLMGIELMVNFNQPYFSADIREFWRRWHISLSTWLRDYLYISLGGNRGGKVRTYFNLLATMVLGGIWHGANWTFVIWGTLHGLLLAGHRVLSDNQPRSIPLWRKALNIGLTFHVVVLAWIFFRADSLALSIDYLQQMAALSWGSITYLPTVLMMASLLLAVDVPQMVAQRHDFLLGWRPVVRAGYVAVLLIAILTIGSQQAYEVPFIYFQF